jgi:hypothetical protein
MFVSTRVHLYMLWQMALPVSACPDENQVVTWYNHDRFFNPKIGLLNFYDWFSRLIERCVSATF